MASNHLPPSNNRQLRRDPSHPTPTPTHAIAIPDQPLEFTEADLLFPASPSPAPSFPPSPRDDSYSTTPNSWRPMPPPMLASSLDTRFRPTLPRPTPIQPPHRLPRPPPAAHLQRTVVASVTPSDASEYGAVDLHPLRQEKQRPVVCEDEDDDEVSGERASLRPPALESRHTPRSADPTSRGPWRRKVDRMVVQARQIREAPRELWLVFALKFLSSFAYFALSLILTLFLTEEFGMSDTAAGWAYGVYGVMSTFFGFLCGWFIDYLGVRASLLLGSLVGAVARFVVATTTSKHTAVLMLFTFLPFAECLGIPIMTIGIKRYTNSRNRTFAFSLFYSVMNVAALVAGPLVDFCRGMFGDGFVLHVAPLDLNVKFSALRLVILSSSVATAAMVAVVLIGIREIHVDDSGNLADFTPNRESPVAQTMAVLREPAFWRLTLFTVLLVGVRLVFRHLDATMPKYLTRQFGPDAPFGMIYAINPFLIIFLVPLVGLMTRKVDSFSMILYGSFVSAASPFWLTIQQSYFAAIMFMVTLSLGEAVYSPRVYEYTMEVSANGAEGLYSSLSTAPLFSVKLLVGGMSGWLLTSFMPVDGPHHGNIMWGIIGLTSMTSPILMCLLRGFISPPPGDDSAVETSVACVESYPPKSDLVGSIDRRKTTETDNKT